MNQALEATAKVLFAMSDWPMTDCRIAARKSLPLKILERVHANTG